jgi:hypothetical protein
MQTASKVTENVGVGAQKKNCYQNRNEHCTPKQTAYENLLFLPPFCQHFHGSGTPKNE